LSLNVELSPNELLIEQAMAIIRKPPEERAPLEPRLREIKVVLIRNMISDQLGYIKIAKNWFTIPDLLNIHERKIGKGKIGGKAAGMLLAQRILKNVGDEDIQGSIRIPNSYFLAADVMYSFMANNNLMHWADQKYKNVEQIREEFPLLQEEYLAGQFSEEIIDDLTDILRDMGNKPLIVRSSSLLEDNFGTSFAGKYDSFFCPNQGTLEENLDVFIKSIIKIYSSALSPDALSYRQTKDLLDYDERVAVLIQEVEGEQVGDYFYPHGAGVAFSRNLYRWSPQIQKDAGNFRLVWGLGTRAVDRVGKDYPRLVALSHPMLHTHSDPRSVRSYSQKEVDVIDLKTNQFT
ncbi:MAG: PEP/pyruvate-binding domain-containing protein, partial [Chloroflexota bacterium]